MCVSRCEWECIMDRQDVQESEWSLHEYGQVSMVLSSEMLD